MKRTYKNQRFNDLASSALAAVTEPGKTAPLSTEIATRERTIDFLSVVLGGLPNPDPVLKKLNRSIEVYETLLYDSRVTACVTSRKSAVQAMEYEVVGETTLQAQIDFHNEYLSTYKIEDMIAEILDASLFGYKPIEIIWQPDGGRIVPVDFVGKPPRWFKYDEENNLRFLSSGNQIDGEELPENKFIVARNRPTYDNPYGKPVLSSCFWPVTFRKNGLKFYTIFVEKYGMPFMIAKAPEGEREEKITETADLLENMVQDAIAVVPKEYEIDIKEAATGGGRGSDPVHKTYLDIMNLEIAMSILGTNLTTEVQGGSFAASKSHMDVRQDIVESDARIVEGAFNELISITHAINFGESDPPRFKLFAEEKVDDVRSKRDKDLTDQGVRFTEEYYKRSYNLTDEDFTLSQAGEPAGTRSSEGVD